MAKISTEIDEQVKNQFRNLAKEKFGKKKNFLALALNQAIDKWISEYKHPNKTIEDFEQNLEVSLINRYSESSKILKEPNLDSHVETNIKLFYTIGYQNKNINLFLELLKKNGVKTLVDIRRNINSQKENFSGVELDNILRQHQIMYVSLPSLGPPNEMRYELYDSKNYLAFFDKFRMYLNNNIHYLEKINKLTFPICLLCYEDKASECHRSIVAEKLIELNNKWMVEHIELARNKQPYEKDLTSFDVKNKTPINQNKRGCLIQ